MTRKKRQSRASTGPDEPFIEGTPLDELGLPEDGAEVSVEDTGHVPVDARSSRIAAEFKNAVSRKSRGEKGIEFNAPDPIKYNGMALAQPAALVRIIQTRPKRNDNIDEQSVDYLKNYELLKRYVRDSYWKGEEAVYSWELHNGRYAYASGTLHFAEDAMARYGHQQQPPPYQQQQPPPPYQQQQPPPPYGMQPMQYPPQQYPPQQPAPPAPATPIQIPAGTDPVIGVLMQELFRQLAEARQESAYWRSMQQQAYPQAAQVTQQQQAPAVPPPPKGPLEQLGEMSAMLREMNTIHNSMRQEFSDGASEPDPAASLQSDEGFPLKVKDFGAVRAVATEDGQVSMPFFANIDKYENIFDGVLGKVTKALNKIADSRVEHMEKQVQIMERAEAVANRTATMRGQPQQALPQRHVVDASAVAMGAASAPSSRPRPAAPPVHPWNSFASVLEETPVVEAPAEVAD